MNDTMLKAITKQWDDATHTVLELKELSTPQLQQLLKETYAVFSTFHTKVLIPKEISKILLCMEEFLYFASLMEENEKGKGFYHWEEMRYIVNALKEGFFAARYKRTFPELVVTDILDNDFLVNLEQDSIADYFAAVRTVKSQAD